MSVIFSGQLLAVATVVLAVFAIATAIVAGRAFRAQSRQLAVELGERSREAEERRRAQAVQVYVWQTPPKTTHALGSPASSTVEAVLVNSSQQPIFGVKTRFMRVNSGVFWGGITIREAPLLPSEQDHAGASIPVGQVVDDLVAVAFFRDRAGIEWATYADGRLNEIAQSATVAPNRTQRLTTWTGRGLRAAVARGRSLLASAAALPQTAWRILRATPQRCARIWPSAWAWMRRSRRRG
jgi:hypothetical protein